MPSNAEPSWGRKEKYTNRTWQWLQLCVRWCNNDAIWCVLRPFVGGVDKEGFVMCKTAPRCQLVQKPDMMNSASYPWLPACGLAVSHLDAEGAVRRHNHCSDSRWPCCVRKSRGLRSNSGPPSERWHKTLYFMSASPFPCKF